MLFLPKRVDHGFQGVHAAKDSIQIFGGTDNVQRPKRVFNGFQFGDDLVHFVSLQSMSSMPPNAKFCTAVDPYLAKNVPMDSFAADGMYV